MRSITVFEDQPYRVSSVLKADGTPFILEAPKQPIGFKLTNKEKDT